MDDNFGRNRIIGFACALIAGMLVIMAGKSCADDAIEQNKKLHESQIVEPDIILPGQGSSEATAPEITEPVMTGYDIFGNVIVITEPPVTDVFGNHIESTAPASSEEEPQFETVTDVFGNIISTVPVTVQTTAVVTVDPALTTTLSPIDQFNQDRKKPNLGSGYDHGRYEYNEENDTYEPIPTIPPDFVIEIN